MGRLTVRLANAARDLAGPREAAKAQSSPRTCVAVTRADPLVMMMGSFFDPFLACPVQPTHLFTAYDPGGKTGLYPLWDMPAWAPPG